MKIIFSYDRPDALHKVLDEVGHATVLDDGSEYDVTPFLSKCDYHRGEHVGKEYFWNTWDYALKLCRDSDADRFMFMPDDWCNYDIERINWLYDNIDGAFAFNYANFGMESCWTSFKARRTKINGYECYQNGFVDCGFFTNRQTLELLGWEMEWISPDRFKRGRISSGVGEQLSRRLFKLGVPMYKPVHSLCEKQDCALDSKMNPIERKINPRPML